jgi:clan AA aspartic protease (TIGR02281 family)
MMRKTTVQLLSIVTLIIFGTGVSSADMVYKCKNAQGKMLYQKTPCAENAQAVNSWTPKTKVKLPEQEPTKKVNEIIVIPQGPGGHYFLDAEVNSHSLTFVVDTGATVVALPRAIAASASLFCNEKALMDTGNGRAGGCTTIITELKLGKGSLVLKNVQAVNMPNLNQPLLGMNVLQNFNIEQKNNEMLLSDQNAK